MRGEIIYFDRERRSGFISGGDGNRYAFLAADVDGGDAVSKGSRVEFEPDGGNARAIRPAGRPPSFAPRLRERAPGESGEVLPSIGDEQDGRDRPRSQGVFALFGRSVSSNYWNFRDRARRKEYWSFALVALLLIVGLGVVGAAVDAALGNMDEERPVATIAATGLLTLALLVPSLAVTVRRLHDIGLSGWFVLVGFIPTIGNLILLVFALIPSQSHDNRWGPAPAGAR